MRVELVRRAEKDLRSLQTRERKRLAIAINDLLGGDHLPESADDKPLAGHRPWRRLRVGDWRVIWREGDGVRYVARVVNRRDLERVVRGLE